MDKNSNTCQINHNNNNNNNNVQVGLNNNNNNNNHHNQIYSNYSTKPISSGSETDVSTSTENLSPEEHYVLKTGIRQEPQGEETYLNLNSVNDGLSFNNTLIIHENNSLNNSMFSCMSPFFYGKRNNVLANNMNGGNKDQMPTNDNYYYHNHSISDNTNNNNANNEMIKLNTNVVSVIDNDSHYSNLNFIKYCNVQNRLPNSQFNESVINIQSKPDQNKISTPDPSVTLQQPMLNNYLNSLKKKETLTKKEFNNLESINLPPPPPLDYYKQWNALQLCSNTKSLERQAISRSHPDLSKFSDDELNSSQNNLTLFSASGACNYNNTLETLLQENSSLRTELGLFFKKVQKLQKFELEIQKVHQSHEELMRTSDKKEKLEQAIRCKFEIELRRLQEENRCIKEQLETNITKRTNYDGIDSIEFKKEINKRDVLITRLLGRNKELIAEKDRQEIELQAQRLTLQEQRNHIEILDTALMNAQNNIITLEAELRKKQGYEEKTMFLKKALSNLQLANERRLQMEKRVRLHLEKEIDEFKKQNSTETNNKESYKHNENDVNLIKRMLREYEEKIINLENDVSKWEQKYLEESTLRSIEVSSASAPKDAKIAALERTSQESEKLIAEARNEHLKHMDEIHLANKKFTELESKLKDMESKLAEKDAMIKVLQKHSEDRDAVLHKTLVRRFPNRHTRSASTMGLVISSNVTNNTNNTNSANANADSLPNDFSKLLVSGTTQRSSSIVNNNLVLNSNCSDSSNLDIDQQLKEIDSQLSSNNSIIQALRSEKERYPNHYNNWRL